MTRVAAIDLSKIRARYVVLDRSLRKTQLLRADELTREPEEEMADFLLRVRESMPPDLDTVAATADASSASTRILNFPFTDLRKVEQTLGFELETQLPYDLEEITSTWTVSHKGEAETSILAAVAPKARIAEQIDLLSEGGLEPRVVMHPGAALAQLVTPAEHEVVAVVAMGHWQSHIAMIDGQRSVRFARSVQWGGVHIDRALAKHFSISADDARKAKENEARLIDAPADDRERKINDAVSEGLGPMVTALSASFRSLPVDCLPQRLLITGGLSRLPGLPEYLEKELGIETELLDLGVALGEVDPPGDEGSKTPRVGPEYAVALGTAWAVARRGGGAELNFRRGDLAYSGDIQLYRGEIVRLSVGTGVVILLALVAAVVRYGMITAVEDEIDQGFCSATKRIVGREICDPTAALSTLKQAPGAGGGVVIPEYSAVSLFDMMSKAVGEKVDVTFSDLDFRLDPAGDTDRIDGKGEAGTFEDTEQLVKALEKDPCVKKATIGKQRKKGDRVEFSLDVDLKCQPGARPGQDLKEIASAKGLANPSSVVSKLGAGPAATAASESDSDGSARKTPGGPGARGVDSEVTPAGARQGVESQREKYLRERFGDRLPPHLRSKRLPGSKMGTRSPALPPRPDRSRMPRRTPRRPPMKDMPGSEEQ